MKKTQNQRDTPSQPDAHSSVIQGTTRERRLDESAILRISLFTGIAHKTGDDVYFAPDRARHIQEAVRIALEHGSDLLVLPGYSFGHVVNMDATQEITNISNMAMLAEIGDFTYYLQPHKAITQLLKQQFGTGDEARADLIENVSKALEDGTRVVTIKGKRVGVLLCGENNIIRNKNHSTPVLRNPDLSWPYHTYDALVNPSHTSMGQWNLLHKRFEFFSSGGRHLLYCTNNRWQSWRTSLCVYRDGKLCTMGDFTVGTDLLQTHIEPEWRLVTVTIS